MKLSVLELEQTIKNQVFIEASESKRLSRRSFFTTNYCDERNVFQNLQVLKGSIFFINYVSAIILGK